MGGSAVDPTPTGDLVEHFDGASDFWNDVYQLAEVTGHTYRRRQQLALEWIDELDLPTGSRVLDVGAGVGRLSLALAQRGIRVTAVDQSLVMLDRIQQRAGQRWRSRIRTVHTDVHTLPFADGSFPVVVALGVLPWVSDQNRFLAELTRVCAPDGHLIVSNDSRQRLHWRLDPLLAPRLRTVRRAVRDRLTRNGLIQLRVTPMAHLREPVQVAAALNGIGTQLLRSAPLGFGPYTFFGRPLLSARWGIRLSTTLERRAATAPMGVQGLAAQQLMLSRRAPLREPTGLARDAGRQRRGGGTRWQTFRAALAKR